MPSIFHLILIVFLSVSLSMAEGPDHSDLNLSTKSKEPEFIWVPGDGSKPIKPVETESKEKFYWSENLESGDQDEEVYHVYVKKSSGSLESNQFKVELNETGLYRGPNESSQFLAMIQEGAIFPVAEEIKDWLMLKVPRDLVEQNVYVHNSVSKLLDNAPYVELTTDRVSLRKTPSLSGVLVFKGSKGDRYPYKMTTGEFYLVGLSFDSGLKKVYASQSDVKISNGVVEISSNFTDLRVGPGTMYAKHTTAKKGDKLIFLAKSGNWVYIALPESFAGAVRSEIQLGEVYNIRSSLNMRRGPATSHPVVRSLRNGARVEILAKSNNWYKLNYNGDIGWASANFIRKITDSEELEIPDAGPTVSNEPHQPPLPVDSKPVGVESATTIDLGDLSKNVRKSGNLVEVQGVPELAQRGQDPFSSDGSSWRPGAYCGPTSMQMVLAYHGVKKSRDWIAMTHPKTGERVQSSSHRGQVYAKGKGSAYKPMVDLAKKLGFKNTKQVWSNSLNDLKSRITAGRPQIVGVRGTIRYKGGGSWVSRAGHIMVVRGFDQSGDVIVNDPAGRGKKKVIRRADFTRIWRGFSVDIAP